MEERFNRHAALAVLLVVSLILIFKMPSHAGRAVQGDVASGDAGNVQPQQSVPLIDLSAGATKDIETFFSLLPFAREQTSYQTTPQEYVVRLRTGDVHLEEGVEQKVFNEIEENGKSNVLVQFYAIPSEEERQTLQAQGIMLLSYVPEAAYLTSALTFPQMEALMHDANVRAISSIRPEYKYAPALLDQKVKLLERQGKVALHVYLFPDADSNHVRASLEQEGFIIDSFVSTLAAFVVLAAREKIRELAEHPSILFIEPAYPPLTPTNDQARQIVNVEPVQAPPYNLDGSGIKLLIYDAGFIDPTHADLRNRVTWGEPASGFPQHATNVAGTAGGTGQLSAGRFRGMAPNVHFVSYATSTCPSPSGPCFYNNPADLDQDYRSAYMNHNVDLASASLAANIIQNGYPCSWFGDYELSSRLLDQLTRDQLTPKGFLAVWSAGNERGFLYVCNNPTYNTITVPGGAKNILTVGALNSDDRSMTRFSSWGPTDDGRLKPDVMAAGCQNIPPQPAPEDYGIYTTTTNNQYAALCGTSMATPGVSGIIALLMQQFKINYWQTTLLFRAPAQLMKSLVLHTAQDWGNPGPDYQSGYGLVNAQAAADLLKNYRVNVMYRQLARGMQDAYIINSLGTQPVTIKATLVWFDPAASPLANPTLVNDLDLKIVDPLNNVHRPLVLNPAQPASIAVPGINRRDPVEQVTLQASGRGAWKIIVSGEAIPQGPQQYTLIITTEGPTVSFIGGPPVIGNSAFNILLNNPDPVAANKPFLVVLHLAMGAIPLGDGRIIPVDPAIPYIILDGTLDANGRATILLPIPNDPSFVGVTAYATFVTLDPAQAGRPEYISAISPPIPMLFQAST